MSGLLLDFFAEVEGVVKELGEERFEAKLSFSCRGEFSCELDTDLFRLDRESFLVLSTIVCSTSTVDTCDAVCVLSNGTGNVDDLLLLLFDRESRFLLGVVF